MVAIPWPKTSAPGKLPHESGGRLINAYWEPLADGARSQGVIRRAPGLKSWAATSQTGYRGGLVVGNTLYAAFSGKVVSFTQAGVPTVVGTLPGTAKVTWARNNVTPTPDILVCDPDNSLFQVTSGSVTSFNGGGVLPACNSVTFQDGYFLVTTGDGRSFASQLNSTVFNASTFVTCQGRPDGLLRGIPFTQLYLVGTDSIEVWLDTAETAPAFPYTPVKVIPKGAIGRSAISGFETGSDKGLIFVGGDRIVYALNGYSPTKISNPDVDRAIGGYVDGGGNVNLIEMFPYTVGGHSWLSVTCPSFTWIYDLDTQFWHERTSYLQPNWRATGAVNAWNTWYCGDSATGNLVSITESAMDETGSPLIWEVRSAPMSAFPSRIAVPRASFDIAQGVGIATSSAPNAVNPTIAISYSDDGGLTWSIPRIRSVGAQSVVGGAISLLKCGRTKTQGRQWRIVGGDPVPYELTGGDMEATPRSA